MPAHTIPVVSDCMSAALQVISPHDTVTDAATLMRERSIRHLLVFDGGGLVGIVSDRDLRAPTGSLEPGSGVPSVGDVMSREVVSVSSDTPLNRAVRVMVSRKVGSLVVMDGKNVAGVMTRADALEALVDLLEGKTPRPELERTAEMPNRRQILPRDPSRDAAR